MRINWLALDILRSATKTTLVKDELLFMLKVWQVGDLDSTMGLFRLTLLPSIVALSGPRNDESDLGSYRSPTRQSFRCIRRCISVSFQLQDECASIDPVIAATWIGLNWWTAGVARLRYYSGDVTCRENKWTCMSKREMLKSRPIEIEKAYKFATKYGSTVIPAGSTTRWL